MIAALLRAVAAAAFALSAGPALAGVTGPCVVATGAQEGEDTVALSLDVRRHPAACGCRSKWMVLALDDADGAEIATGRFVLEPDIGPATVDVPVTRRTAGAVSEIRVGCAGE